MRASVLFVIAVMAGCGLQPRTAEEQANVEYRRADDRVKSVERFERLKRGCETAVVVRSDRGRIGEPTADEMRLATCSRRR